jgi:hypothetical protein
MVAAGGLGGGDLVSRNIPPRRLRNREHLLVPVRPVGADCRVSPVSAGHCQLRVYSKLALCRQYLQWRELDTRCFHK